MQTKHEFLRRISAIIAVFFTLAFTGCGQTPESPGSLPVSGVVSETTAQSGQETAGVSESGSFTIHFIDVGQADSTLVTCDGHSMLIDGGNADDSNLVYSVLQRETDGHLDYVVGTHAHEDHIGGLSGAFEADTADVTFCPVTEYDSKAFRNFKARADERGGGITVPAVGDTFTLGEASVTVVAVNSVPEDTNNTSIVIRIVYGDTSFLFTGDAEQETEEKILETGQDIESTVLKVGHHGSSTSTSQAFLDAVSPTYAVISCGKDNSYGHPHSETLAKLSSAGVEVLRTDELGDIYCTSDGTEVTFSYGEYHKDSDITLAVVEELTEEYMRKYNSPNTQEIMFRLLVELAKQYKTVRFVLNINGKTTEVKYPVKGMMNSDILYGGGFSTCNITPRSEENRIEEFIANNDSQLEDNRRIPIKYIPEVYYGNKLIWKNPNFANT